MAPTRGTLNLEPRRLRTNCDHSTAGRWFFSVPCTGAACGVGCYLCARINGARRNFAAGMLGEGGRDAWVYCPGQISRVGAPLASFGFRW